MEEIFKQVVDKLNKLFNTKISFTISLNKSESTYITINTGIFNQISNEKFDKQTIYTTIDNFFIFEKEDINKIDDWINKTLVYYNNIINKK